MTDGLWVYLAASPLLWLAGTLVVWIAASSVAKFRPGNPFLNPIMLTIAAIAGILCATGIDYGTYFEGAQFIHFLLGPATVALGIPLYEKLSLVKSNLVPMLSALVVGCLAAVGSTVFLSELFGFAPAIVASLAPKSTTAAVAMAISSGLKGDPALTAAVVVFTGICGAVVVTPMMNAMRIKDFSARRTCVPWDWHRACLLRGSRRRIVFRNSYGTECNSNISCCTSVSVSQLDSEHLHVDAERRQAHKRDQGAGCRLSQWKSEPGKHRARTRLDAINGQQPRRRPYRRGPVD
ncbi:Inner membrane protein YohK [Ensifer adhaerens]|nr:Inner membrane protein YohK [Ensifer adhaerens]